MNVSVNISIVQLIQDEFADKLIKLLMNGIRSRILGN
jgi:EAL domain-containing protein (putative c-di-GMP-specific phosphodiesterase class I)